MYGVPDRHVSARFAVSPEHGTCQFDKYSNHKSVSSEGNGSQESRHHGHEIQAGQSCLCDNH